MVISGSEYREHFRMDYKADVAYKILGEYANKIGNVYREALTKNISKGGLCIEIPMKVDDGDVMLLDVTCGDKSINTIGEVVWCKRTQNGYEAGLNFVNIKPSDVDFLEKITTADKTIN